MKKYLGVKVIQAEPMSEAAFINQVKNEDIPQNCLCREGYKVVYEDGYTSWSPKEVFEKAYREIENLSFGVAMEAVKSWICVSRIGLDGVIVRQVPSNIPADIIPKMTSLSSVAKETILRNIDHLEYNNQLIKINFETSKVDTWLPTVDDVFNETWYIVE